MAMDADIAKRVEAVEDRIVNSLQSSGRKRQEVTLVGVSKRASADRIVEAYRAGVRVFGESYAQEAMGKMADPVLSECSEIRFHFIGHLQRSKVKQIADKFSLIQSVDRFELVQCLASRVEQNELPQAILCQVNVSRETQKSGVLPERVSEVVASILGYPQLALQGLMCIGSLDCDEKERRAEFALLRDTRDSLSREFNIGLPELSMGMSDDYHWAIEEGATIVRVGSAIFGSRSA